MEKEIMQLKPHGVLQLRLQQRRTREQLADQGIMPPLKSPSAFHEQRKNLERAKTEDYLKHKIRSRPEQSDLVNMHILQDSAAEGSIQATQMKLKRARLADDLNEKIALRPGPLELVEKNIIPVDSAVKEAIKGAQGSFSKSADAFAFEEDSSNDGLSPEQARREDLQGSTESTAGTKNSEAISSATSGTTQDHSHSSENNVTDLTSVQNSQCESPKQVNGQQSPPLPVPAVVKSKSSSDSKNRHKKPKDAKPKVKKLKYHQYIPPDQKAEKSPPPMDSAYARLLQQQQLFLQLQILSQQHQQHFSYPGIPQAQHKQPSEQMVKSSNSSSTPVTNMPLSPVKTTFSGQTCVSSIKPGPLPSNLDDLKVSELRQQLRIRGLPVSGTKTALMERLRPFQDCSGSVVPNFNEITTVTFPVTPTNTLSSYQSQPSASMLSSSFYQFGSTSSSPPISPASSDLSVSGSLPDTFNDGPITSPQFGLQPSPVHGSAEESLMGSMNGGSIQLELEGIDTEKDKMLVEKQKVINELTWKLQQEQRQVEELRMQLQKRKRNNGLEEKQPPTQHFFGVPIKQENAQMTRSQQMDELLDVLIESGEMPAIAKEDRSCLQKVPQITVSSGNTSTSLPKASAPFEHVSSAQLSFDHCTGSNDTHLEVLLNSQSPLGKVSEIPLLKMGGEESHFEGLIDGFSSKVADELLTSQEIPLSPMETQLSPSSAEGSGLQMSFTESPWETMEWLDLTPPSSATGFGSFTTTGPSLFNIDFLDVTDLSLNTTMDLHLQQW
ncbi:Myocardin [Chelonia mydas]|uniref:Myocardin n=1 Tax=Chelonia mydas TaxID=8469 RepID=M7AH97_CHEMY|nr:Myocardin [Chelonia mydas]